MNKRAGQAAFFQLLRGEMPLEGLVAFGHYIRRQREGRDMTLTDLARRIDVSIAYLSRIERERENPPPDHLISALAGALRVPTDDLFAAACGATINVRAQRQSG